jgi:hypothetical protein
MKSFLTAAVVVATATPAFADPAFTYGKADDVKDVKTTEWHASAEGGVVFTTGNSETTTATGGIKLARKSGNNLFAFEGAAAYAKAGVRTLDDKNGNGLIDNSSEIVTTNTLTAETLNAKARYDRFLTTDNSLFAAVLASRDLPAGKYAVFGGQLGYSRMLYKSKTAESHAEIGYDFSEEELVAPMPGEDRPTTAIHSARIYLGYKGELTPGATLDTSIEALSNLNHESLPTMQDGSAFYDTRVNLHLAISAKIGKNLAFQTAVDSHFDNRPAPLLVPNETLAPGFVPAAGKLDTIMKASLIYTIF